MHTKVHSLNNYLLVIKKELEHINTFFILEVHCSNLKYVIV